LLLVQDITTGQMPLPVTSTDKVIVRGRELAIVNAAERKAPTGELVAYELQVRG
jgi:hypothetical protein